MPIQEIKNAITGEHGFQARYYGWSAYASITKHGKREAYSRVEAKLNERMRLHPVEPKVKRGVLPPGIKPRQRPGFSGVYFEWRTYSAGKAYPCIDGHYRRPNGKGTTFLTNFSYAILSNGIYGAAMKAIAVKNMYGYPCPDIHTLANELLRWLKETSKQHNFDFYDIPDITKEGRLMQVQNVETKKKILVIGNSTAPTTCVLKENDEAHLIEWSVIAKGGDKNRVQSALKADNTSATKKQRIAAAEALVLVAVANDADGYFVSVGNDLMPFVEKAFRENDLAIIAPVLGAGNVPVMVYK